jgi:hypothetical protein
MISKIVQKNKKQQEELIRKRDNCQRAFEYGNQYAPSGKSYRWYYELTRGKIIIHKQSLIILKEYMEGQLVIFNPDDDWNGRRIGTRLVFKETSEDIMKKEEIKNLFRNTLDKVECDLIDQFQEDIKELNIMIERYE